MVSLLCQEWIGSTLSCADSGTHQPREGKTEKDPGLEKGGGECKAGSRSNLNNAEFRTQLLQLEQLLRARPWSESTQGTELNIPRCFPQIYQ